MSGPTERVVLILGSCLLFCLFFYSAPPGLVFGDGAELTYGLLTGQIVHPPGYPLYRLLGQGLLFLGPAGAGLTASALAALFGCLTVAVFYLFLRRRSVGVGPSGVTLLLVVLSLPVWDLFMKPEVYSLAAFFFASTLFGWDLVLREGRGRLALWWIVGLSLTHHPLGVLNVVLALHVTVKSHPAFRVSEALGVVLPTGLYGLLLFPGSGFPFNWPEIRTAGELVKHLLGGSFGRFFLSYGSMTPFIQFGRILAAHLVAFPVVVAVIAGLGYVILPRDLRPLVVLQGLFLVGVSFYGVPDLHDFLLPSFLITAVALAYGLDACWQRGIVAIGFALVFCVVSYGFVGYLLGETFRYNWRSYDYPSVYAREVEPHLRQGVLLSDWSHYAVLRYEQLVRGRYGRVHLLTPTHRYERWPAIVRYHRRRGRSVYTTIRSWDRHDDLMLLERGPIYEITVTGDG